MTKLTASLLMAAALYGCTPQQSASLMPMMGMGTSMGSQAMNLYFQEQRLQQQQQMLRNQQPSYVR